MSSKLSQQEIDACLGKLRGWEIKDGKLHRECEFGSSTKTFAFMTHVTRLSQMLNRRPELTNVHNKVRVSVSGNADGVTRDEIDIAEKIDEIVQHQGGR